MVMKKFHLGDILAITTGRLVSPRGMEGVYDILNYMTGDNLWTHQLSRVAEECRPYLLKQYPQFSKENMHSELIKLDKMLETERGKTDPEKIVLSWFAKHVGKYEKKFPVESFPSGVHEEKNPIEEACDIMGPEKVIVSDGSNKDEIVDILKNTKKKPQKK